MSHQISNKWSRKKSKDLQEVEMARKRGVEDLEKLASLLKSETDRWSRRVILEEVAAKLQSLEQLLETEKRAS